MSETIKPKRLATIDLSVEGHADLSQRLSEFEFPPEDPATDSNAHAKVEIQGADGQDNLLMALDRRLRIKVRGKLGNYALAFNQQAQVRVTGDAGDGLGESMMSGAVRIHGNVGVGLGVAMTGGTLAVYGNAGDGCGAALRGGEIFVRGNVGHNAAHGALHGTLVIGGDAGNNLGEAMMDAVIYIRGKYGSLGQGVIDLPMKAKDQVRLGVLLINAGIRGEAKEFRRIVPQHIYDDEQKLRSYVGHPSWR